MKRFLLLLVILAVSVFLMAACNDEGGKVEDTTPNDVVEDVVEDLAAPVIICEGKDTQYNIIYPDGADNNLVTLARGIAEKITDLGGKMRASNDWTRNVEATAANYEILVGNTNRPETREVMDSIGYDDYAIRQVDNKIVIAAHAEDRLIEAIEYFNANSVKADTVDGKAVVVYVANYQFKGDREYFINHENPLAGYRIVSSADSVAKSNAQKFADAIKQIYGVELEVVTDSTPAVEREIVIGKTNRDISTKYINSTNPFIYTIKAEGNTLLIGAENNAANSYVVKKLENEMNDVYDSTFNFPAGYETHGNAGNFKNSAELTEGADIRIFSFNVLFNNTLKDPTPAERSIALGSILAYFEPDVLGLQEFNDAWYNVFRTLDERYEIVDRTNGKGKMNNSTIAYNTEKLKLLEHGIKIYSKGDRDHLRLANWAYFEDIDSGKKFVVINTHWDIVDEYRMTQAEEMAKLANELSAKYGCAVLTTGDYNRRESTAEYKRFIELTGYVNSKYTAAVKGNVHSTSHGFDPLGTMPSTSTVESIDHILGNDKVEFLYFTVLTDQIVLDNSDHCPIFADVKLK